MGTLQHHKGDGVALCVFCAALFIAAIASFAAPAESAAREEYIHKLESSYRAVQTLQATFTQTYVWGGRTRVESGTVKFAKGGLMRWDYHNPQKKIFLSDGKHLLLYVPDEQQLTRSLVKSSDDIRVPFRLLLSRLRLRKVFSRIDFADPSLKHDPRDGILRAYPRAGYDQDYKDVLIEVTPEYDITRLVVSYPDRSSMEFLFENVQRNIPLGPGVFHFTPPPGTQIIDQP